MPWSSEVGEGQPTWGLPKSFAGHLRPTVEGGEDSCQAAGRKVRSSEKGFLDEWHSKSKDTNSRNAGYFEGNNGWGYRLWQWQNLGSNPSSATSSLFDLG